MRKRQAIRRAGTLGMRRNGEVGQLADRDWEYGQDDETFIYGEHFFYQLVFMPKAWAEHMVLFRDAVQAETWGELRTKLTPEAYQELVEAIWGSDEGPEPPPETPFSERELPGYGDMEAFPWVNREMMGWVPAEVQREYASRGASMVSGPGIWFEPQDKDAIVAMLEGLGYTCVEDDSMVYAVCGT